MSQSTSLPISVTAGPSVLLPHPQSHQHHPLHGDTEDHAKQLQPHTTAVVVTQKQTDANKAYSRMLGSASQKEKHTSERGKARESERERWERWEKKQLNRIQFEIQALLTSLSS